jgi:hypothetical protein
MNGLRDIMMHLVLAAARNPAMWDALHRAAANVVDRLRAWFARYDAAAGAPA